MLRVLHEACNLLRRLPAAALDVAASGVTKVGGVKFSNAVIGQTRAGLDRPGAGFVPDHAYRISDEEAFGIVFDVAREEGIVLGGSSGINLVGARALARELGPGHTIVTILCDYGHRYQSKVYNPAFMRAKNLPVPGWMEPGRTIDVPFADA